MEQILKTDVWNGSTRKPFNLNISDYAKGMEEIGGRPVKKILKVSVASQDNPEIFNVGFANRATLDVTAITLDIEVIALTKNEYPHFNPAKYDVQVKIATVRTSSHSKHNINYHLIWIPKYRKKILTGKIVHVLKSIIDGQCEEMGLSMLALEVMPDHIHLFVGARPTHTPFKIINKLKGNTSIQLRRCFPNLKYLGYRLHYKKFSSLWADGYYCGSAGHVSQDSVRRYILEQWGKDVFEYNVYGDPQRKIGDFR